MNKPIHLPPRTDWEREFKTPLREVIGLVHAWKEKNSSSHTRMNPLEGMGINPLSRKHGALLSMPEAGKLWFVSSDE